MKRIKLSGKYNHLECILDDGWAKMFEDGGISLLYRIGYASVFTGKSNKFSADFVHQIIMGTKTTGRGVVIDHINQNKLDNRSCNLRLVNKSENALNSSVIKSHNKSGTSGVCYSKRGNAWRIYLAIGGKRVYHRQIKNKEEAILVATFNNAIKLL